MLTESSSWRRNTSLPICVTETSCRALHGGTTWDRLSLRRKRGRARGRGCGRGDLIQIDFVDEAACFAGTSKEDRLMLVCPLLLEFVAKEIERYTGFLKQVHKAREERSALSE